MTFTMKYYCHHNLHKVPIKIEIIHVYDSEFTILSLAISIQSNQLLLSLCYRKQVASNFSRYWFENERITTAITLCVALQFENWPHSVSV